MKFAEPTAIIKTAGINAKVIRRYTIMQIHCECCNCPYAETTDNFWILWCIYHRKIVYRTSGCTREDN